MVEQYEIPQLIKCFENIGNYEPKVVFFSVQKRINTTLYARVSNTYSTPPPGTVLDHTLTKRDWSVRACVLAAVNSDWQTVQSAGLRMQYCCVLFLFLQDGFLPAGTQHPPRLRSSHPLHLFVQHHNPVNWQLAEVKHQSGENVETLEHILKSKVLDVQRWTSAVYFYYIILRDQGGILVSRLSHLSLRWSNYFRLKNGWFNEFNVQSMFIISQVEPQPRSART